MKKTLSIPTLDDLRTIHRQVGRVAQDGEALVSHDGLADATGLHPAKIRITLSELEQAGALLHLGDQVGYSRWRILSPAKGALGVRARAIACRPSTPVTRGRAPLRTLCTKDITSSPSVSHRVVEMSRVDSDAVDLPSRCDTDARCD